MILSGFKNKKILFLAIFCSLFFLDTVDSAGLLGNLNSCWKDYTRKSFPITSISAEVYARSADGYQGYTNFTPDPTLGYFWFETNKYRHPGFPGISIIQQYELLPSPGRTIDSNHLGMSFFVYPASLNNLASSPLKVSLYANCPNFAAMEWQLNPTSTWQYIPFPAGCDKASANWFLNDTLINSQYQTIPGFVRFSVSEVKAVCPSGSTVSSGMIERFIK